MRTNIFRTSINASMVVLTLFSSASAFAEAWDSLNNPENMGKNYTHKFGNLPLAAQVPEERTPWSESYWPDFLGGIAYRWNTPNHEALDYKSPSKEDAQKMSTSELERLSPAEKYDLFRGDYKYSFTKSAIRDAYGRGFMGTRGKLKPYWTGICEGWAVAAVNLQEPIPVTVQSRDGIMIPFGSSDVKALLSLFSSYPHNRAGSPAHQVGGRCNIDIKKKQDDRGNSSCKDVNAGAFHIVLANQIGLMGRAFVADVTRDVEIWNNPVYKYTAHVITEAGPSYNSAPGTVRQILVQTDMVYADDDEKYSKWNAVVGTPDFKKDTKHYRYWLELDVVGNIIGGEWVTQERPDFLWNREPFDFNGPFQELSQIYRHK